MDVQYSRLKENDDLETDEKLLHNISRRHSKRAFFLAVLCHLAIFALYSTAFGYFAYHHFLHNPMKYCETWLLGPSSTKHT